MECKLIAIRDTQYVCVLKCSKGVTRIDEIMNDHEGHIARMRYVIKKSCDRSLTCTECDLVLPLSVSSIPSFP